MADCAADLMMECVEEEMQFWPQTETLNNQEEDRRDGVLSSPVCPWVPSEEETAPPVWVIPLPVQPADSCCSIPPTHTNTPKYSGPPLGFTLNGRLIPLLPGGCGAELKLVSLTGGSVSGFTNVQLPGPVRVKKEQIHTLLTHTQTHNLQTAAEATPIITGVVSGEAAERVLINHSATFTPTPSPNPPHTLTHTVQPHTHTVQPHTHRPGPIPSLPIRGRPPHKPLLKVINGPVSPSNCLTCKSHYRLIAELRGFLCLCSPAIADSLKDLRRLKMNQRRRNNRNKKKKRSFTRPHPKEYYSRETSEAGPGITAVSLFQSEAGPGITAVSLSAHTQSKSISPLQKKTQKPVDTFHHLDQFTLPPSPVCSPPSAQALTSPGTPPSPLQGKLVIMVDDFYYGSAPVRPKTKNKMERDLSAGPYRCLNCPQSLDNNIQFMDHMRQHLVSLSEEAMDSCSLCPHCFRQFSSAFRLQCHLEAVHSQCQSTAKCKICELAFINESAFLWHMKTNHFPGEMPYVCQVCDYRSSFYSDVWTHFLSAHSNSRNLLCQYCLRVLKSKSGYQQHLFKHQRKHQSSCDRCRLHFLQHNELMDHTLTHVTHVKPQQLMGLKPGTKVTVRTYSVVGPSDGLKLEPNPVPCKVVDVAPPPYPPKQEVVPKRKPVEVLGSLLSNLNPDQSEACGVSRPTPRCIECLFSVVDFPSHFPSLVHCSLCHFVTCCSMSYANHMVSKHAIGKKAPVYQSIFVSNPRLTRRLRCVSCMFSTFRGDVMAIHLTERPDHCCVMLTDNDQRENNTRQTHSSDSVTSHPVSTVGGSFVPIQRFNGSSQLSVKALHAPSALSSPPAMIIKFLAIRKQEEQSSLSPLSDSQLPVVLSALCHGVAGASRRFHTPVKSIVLWARERRTWLCDQPWSWRTGPLAEWVMGQREQQITVSEDVLLQTSRKALGQGAELKECYGWSVDFLLHHDLSLQPMRDEHLSLQPIGDERRPMLPRRVREKRRRFTHSLNTQIRGKSLPARCLGCMDEFSVFLDTDSSSVPTSLRVFGTSGEERPSVDITLSALSDGTLLTPLLFFSGQTHTHVPEGFPQNVSLHAKQEGFTDQERLDIWVEEVWRPHVVSLGNSGCVLMVDGYRGHMTERFTECLSSVSTETAFIPSACNGRSQPLDVCVTPILRDFLQSRWSQLASQEGALDGFSLDQLSLTLSCWVSELCSTLNADTSILARSFACVRSVGPENRGEVARMIQTLTRTLVQPLETEDVMSHQEVTAGLQETMELQETPWQPETAPLSCEHEVTSGLQETSWQQETALPQELQETSWQPETTPLSCPHDTQEMMSWQQEIQEMDEEPSQVMELMLQMMDEGHRKEERKDEEMEGEENIDIKDGGVLKSPSALSLVFYGDSD